MRKLLLILTGIFALFVFIQNALINDTETQSTEPAVSATAATIVNAVPVQ